MIAPTSKKIIPEESRKKLGILAEFRSPDDLRAATKRLREAGYSRLEAYSPFPIHGMDEALSIRRSPLPWFVLGAGIVGGVSALAFQWWTNTIDYPYIVSGKPLFSLPANIPVTFEVVILLAAFAAFFGMLMLNGLPKLANPLLQNERFRRVTDDGFFLLVEATDKKYSDRTSADVLDNTSATNVEELEDRAESAPIPRGIVLTLVVLGSLALLPPLMIAKARATNSEKPRLHNFFDMDFQPKFKSQAASPLFADGRAMRPRVEGTIPRGSLLDERFAFGVEPAEREQRVSPPEAVKNVDSTNTPDYVTSIPIRVTEKLMREGRTQFNIHCAVCHGKAGYGNGLASQRALELEQGTWVPPTSLHAPHVLEQPDGQLFNSITNGVRKMPAYGHQINPRDRWAIVAYVRALQRSQKTSIDDVPDDYRQTLREFN